MGQADPSADIEQVARRTFTYTRRRALQLGTLAGTAAVLGGPAAPARAANRTPLALRRATYVPLVGQGFDVGGRLLSLESVADVEGAAGDASLRGHDEAFVLSFTGATGLEAATHRVAHRAFGSADLLVAPVALSDGASQRYELVVDRSVGRPADPPEPAPGRSSPPAHPGDPEAAAAALATFERKVAAKAARAAKARRGRRQRTTGTAVIRRRRKATRRRKRAARPRAPRR